MQLQNISLYYNQFFISKIEMLIGRSVKWWASIEWVEPQNIVYKINKWEYVPVRTEKLTRLKPWQEPTKSQKARNPHWLSKKYYIKKEDIANYVLSLKDL